VILRVHKERVDRLDLDKIDENYVSCKKEKLRKFGWILWTVWEFCRLITYNGWQVTTKKPRANLLARAVVKRLNGVVVTFLFLSLNSMAKSLSNNFMMVCTAGNDLICRIKDVESGEQCFCYGNKWP